MKHVIGGLVLSLAVCAAALPANADGFMVTSSSIPAQGLLPLRYAFNGNGTDNTPCGGGNVSPQVAWTNAPAGTQSLAVVLFDVDGGKGLGTVHWVTYGIAPGVSTLPEGAGSVGSSMMMGGVGTAGSQTYRGPCAPHGDAPHHYVLSVYALDLAPSAFTPGLNRDALFALMKGHFLGATSMVANFVR
jgi:Raf kinase inhibitor-like YbhB/YbcL family protein